MPGPLRPRRHTRKELARRTHRMAGDATIGDASMIHRRTTEARGGLVATLAGRRGRDVLRRLGHDPRISATMTGRTPRRDPRVIHRGSRERGRGLMARLAPERGWNVIRRFAQGRPTVMAGGAAGRDPCVVIACGHKNPIRRTHSVAAVARGRSRHMPSRLPAGLHSVVTGYAGAGRDPLMCEGRSRPAHCAMATIAGHRGWEMRRGLSLCGTVVMAS